VANEATPIRIRLTDERREQVAERLQGFCFDEFEIELSDFRVQRLIDFLVVEMGSPIYNQAIQDARRFLGEKLDDLEGEFYEPESEG